MIFSILPLQSSISDIFVLFRVIHGRMLLTHTHTLRSHTQNGRCAKRNAFHFCSISFHLYFFPIFFVNSSSSIIRCIEIFAGNELKTCINCSMLLLWLLCVRIVLMCVYWKADYINLWKCICMGILLAPLFNTICNRYVVCNNNEMMMMQRHRC